MSFHLRQAILAPRRTTATKHPPMRSQVRRINLYSHAINSRGFGSKPADFSQWKKLPTTATTGETSAKRLWLHNRLLTELDQQEISVTRFGVGGEVREECAIMNIPQPGVGLVRHPEDKKLPTPGADGVCQTLPHFYRARLFSSRLDDERNKKPKSRPEHLLPVPKMLHKTRSGMHGLRWLNFLRQAYAFIESGEIVEVHCHVLPKRRQRDMLEMTNYMRSNPHLWPAVVVRAMPLGTGFIMLPWTNENEVIWAMGLPHEKTRSCIRQNFLELQLPPLGLESPGRHISPGTTILEGVLVLMYDMFEPLTTAMDRLILARVEKEKKRLQEREKKRLQEKERKRLQEKEKKRRQGAVRA